MTGGKSDFKLDSAQGGAAVKTVNIKATNASVVDLTGAINPTTVDASESTGNLSLDVTYAADTTVTGGAGDDTILFGANFDTDDTVDGGEGTNTLGANAAQFAAFTAAASNISNIQRLQVEDDLANDTIDMDYFSGIDYIQFAAAVGAGTGDIDNLASGSTLRFDAKFTGTHTVNVKEAAAGASDSLSIDLQGTTTVDFTADDVESFDVNTANSTGAEQLNLTAKDAAGKGRDLDMTLTGDQALTLNLTSDHTTVEVDGSAMTAGLTADLSAVTGGPATLIGGSKADRLTGGVGAYELTGGAGADEFVFNNFGAADEITDFTTNVDNIELSVVTGTFNAATKANGLGLNKAVDGIVTETGTITFAAFTGITLADANVITAANTAAFKSLANAQILAQTNGGANNYFGLGKVGNDLYGYWVGTTGAPSAVAVTATAIRQIATVGASFAFSDIVIA